MKGDPADKLPVIEAQSWTEDKHDALRRYLGGTHAVRRKFLPNPGATYVELFCGPGRLYLKDERRLIDGSPLVAHQEVTRTKTNFTAIHLADERQSSCDAVEKRLNALGVWPVMHPLKSEAAAKRIVRALDSEALNFAFLDPYNLADLPVGIFETFAPLRRIDLLVHVSAMDLIRALPASIKSEAAPLDRFAPGWRKAIRGLKSGPEARGKVIEHWVNLNRDLGFRSSKVWKLIAGPNNQPLYWLVLIAKHELATELWDKVNKSKQGGLF